MAGGGGVMEGYRKLAFMNTQNVRTQLAASQASAVYTISLNGIQTIAASVKLLKTTSLFVIIYI